MAKLRCCICNVYFCLVSCDHRARFLTAGGIGTDTGCITEGWRGQFVAKGTHVAEVNTCARQQGGVTKNINQSTNQPTSAVIVSNHYPCEGKRGTSQGTAGNGLGVEY